MAEDFGFDLLLGIVREFHAGAGEEFDAVVVIGIVRGGNHDARGEAVLAHQAGNAGRADDAGGSGHNIFLAQSGGDLAGDMRAGFARVHADEDARGSSLAAQIRAETASDPEKRVVVQGKLSWNAANPVRPEQFSRHARLTRPE